MAFPAPGNMTQLVIYQQLSVEHEAGDPAAQIERLKDKKILDEPKEGRRAGTEAWGRQRQVVTVDPTKT